MDELMILFGIVLSLFLSIAVFIYPVSLIIVVNAIVLGFVLCIMMGLLVLMKKLLVDRGTKSRVRHYKNT